MRPFQFEVSFPASTEKIIFRDAQEFSSDRLGGSTVRMDPKYEKLSPTTSGQVEPSIVSCLSNVK